MARYDRNTTAEEIARTADLRGKQVVITGASSGIGTETARVLAMAGADLVLSGRNAEGIAKVADGIAKTARGRIGALPLETTDLASVAAFAAQVSGPVDLLILNAGVSNTPDSHLPNGLELRFATNHLGHFLLALLLQKQMAAHGARIVALSSAAHKGMRVCLDDLQWQKRPFTLAAYGESKTANILFAMEATRRWAAQGIFANAVFPGVILTGLQRHHSKEMIARIGFRKPDGTLDPIVKTTGQGAATTVWAALAPELAGRGGLVLEDCAEALVAGPGTHPYCGYDPSVLDMETARALWERSIELIRDLRGTAPT